MSPGDIADALNDIFDFLQTGIDYPVDLPDDLARLLPRLRELTTALHEKCVASPAKRARTRRKGGAK